MKNHLIRLRCEAFLKEALERYAKDSGHDDTSKLIRSILTQWCLDQELKALDEKRVKP